MPNFTVAVSGNSTVTEWTDSRLNPVAGHPHLYYQASIFGGAITLTATVDGVAGPLDATLGGDTFTHSFAEVPLWPAPSISSPAGQSSVCSFTPNRLGMALVFMRRINGGAVGIHFYVIDPS
jgi:hypothetical protein